MALLGELKGLNGTVCEDCGTWLPLGAYRSGAGWYLGYSCRRCGPYSRETGYFVDHKEATAALDAYLEEGTVPPNIRTTEYRPGPLKILEWDPSQALLESLEREFDSRMTPPKPDLEDLEEAQ